MVVFARELSHICVFSTTTEYTFLPKMEQTESGLVQTAFSVGSIFSYYTQHVHAGEQMKGKKTKQRSRKKVSAFLALLYLPSRFPHWKLEKQATSDSLWKWTTVVHVLKINHGNDMMLEEVVGDARTVLMQCNFEKCLG